MRRPIAMDYRPSQPHGWPAATPDEGVGKTIGGHTRHQDFAHDGKPYRLSLLGFAHPGDSPNPSYERTPGHPDVGFKQTLSNAYGAHYAFRYRGGLHGKLSVQSYSVFYSEAGPHSPVAEYGGDLYVVYETDRLVADVNRVGLRWIQVAKASAPGSPGSYVDSMGRANPFYMFGGLTSINGTRQFNFYYGARVPVSGGPNGDAALSDQFVAEVFLVRDTRFKNAAGKDIIEVYGGLRYGWQVRPLAGSTTDG